MMAKFAIAPLKSTHQPSLSSLNYMVSTTKRQNGNEVDICGLYKWRSLKTAICRASSTSFGTFFDDEFSKKIEEMSMKQEPPDWPMVIEQKASNTGIPISLRLIKRKRQCLQQEDDFSESTYCSAKKAFASMVFIIRELHSYTLQMREVLSYEDSSRVLARVQQEIHTSFVWLFEHVFSQTPTLMVYVMLLLANFTVESMANNVGIVISTSMVDEACEMQAVVRGEALDSETVKRLVAPVKVEMDSDKGYAEYFMTELRYLMCLARDPNNPLLLANFAQFLYLVVQDYGRAEEYFKKATAIEPKDGEACYKYANFLWNTKNDVGAAEDAYVDALSDDPGNTYYASTYANFLWNTGGKETCFPLNNPEDGEPCDG